MMDRDEIAVIELLTPEWQTEAQLRAAGLLMAPRAFAAAMQKLHFRKVAQYADPLQGDQAGGRLLLNRPEAILVTHWRALGELPGWVVSPIRLVHRPAKLSRAF